MCGCKTLPPSTSKESCWANKYSIRAAIDMWALSTQATNGQVVTWRELMPYLPKKRIPMCPNGGTYIIGGYRTGVTCSICDKSDIGRMKQEAETKNNFKKEGVLNISP